MKAKELKDMYLNFFKSKKHAIIPSASLIPVNDATVLFNTAGMQPLVPFLTGSPHPKGKRLVNMQKCLRTVDFENIGDNTHHTFFLMLGNWSLGDYFKKEAIEWSFEFLTKELKIPLNMLAATVYEGDDQVPKDEESAQIWKDLGFDEKRIAYLGKDNFWIAGETGPCGPSTEMFYWTSGGDAPAKYDPEDERWVEIWNDVFMAYNKECRTLLVDGMKCLYDKEFKLNEKLLDLVNAYEGQKILVVNGFADKAREILKPYGIDVFSFDGEIKKEEGEFFTKLMKKYDLEASDLLYFDHGQANIDSATKLGIVSQLWEGNVDKTADFVQKNKFTCKPLANKNVDTGMGFERTLAVLNGQKSAYETDLFQDAIAKLEELSGKSYKNNQKAMRVIVDHIRAAVFILGDENSVTPSNVDRGYILRRLIRRAVRFGKMLGISESFTSDIGNTLIQLYQDLFPELKKNANTIKTELQKEEERFEQTLEKGLKEFDKMSKGNISGKDAFLLFQSYGFPLEMTEELADEKGITVDVEVFFKEYEDHKKLSKTGAEKKFKGGLADLSGATVKLHTANHILNEALRNVISKDIHQRGSNITPERLRFDFNFERKLTKEELQAVEDEVNRVIQEGMDVVRKEMSQKEALEIGAEMEFGQKYPDTVSVYFVGDYSKEFCGGPHVENTKDIGHFKIIKEQSSAAGIRRIKAVVSDEPIS